MAMLVEVNEYGIDVSDYAISQAKKYTKESYCLNVDYDNLPFQKRFFDVIVIEDFLEHIKKPKEFLSKITELLADGGHIVITTVNYNSIGRKLFKNRWTNFSGYYHISPYITMNDLRRWLYPLKIVEHWSLGFMIPYPKIGRTNSYLLVSALLFSKYSPFYYVFKFLRTQCWDAQHCIATSQKTKDL